MALSKAKQDIVVNHLSFASCIASKFISCNPDISPDDIRGTAYEGLCNAADSYNPACGTKFTTYAYRVIKNSLKQLAKDLGTRLYTSHSTERVFLVSIDNFFDREGDCHLDIPDTPDDGLEHQTKTDNQIHRAMALLSPQQRTIITHYYGLNCTKPLSCRSIAKMLNLSENSVFLLHQKALNILRLNEIKITTP